MSSILDMAVGGRISNPGKSVRGIFVNPANPEMLMGSAFAAVDQKNKRFKDPKSYAKAAQKEYQKQARSMKSDLSRSESAAFERLGKDLKRFEEQASMMLPSSVSTARR